MWLIVVDAVVPQRVLYKLTMKTMAKEGGDQIKRLGLANFLWKTPQAMTMEAPAMLVMKCIPRDLIQPNLRISMENRQIAQKK